MLALGERSKVLGGRAAAVLISFFSLTSLIRAAGRDAREFTRAPRSIAPRLCMAPGGVIGRARGRAGLAEPGSCATWCSHVDPVAGSLEQRGWAFHKHHTTQSLRVYRTVRSEKIK